MSRSLKKGYYTQQSLVERVIKLRGLGSKSSVKTWSRRSTIIPVLVGTIVEVYNGRKFLKVHISEDMVGHKLGEFAHTRTFKKHPATKKSNIK